MGELCIPYYWKHDIWIICQSIIITLVALLVSAINECWWQWAPICHRPATKRAHVDVLTISTHFDKTHTQYLAAAFGRCQHACLSLARSFIPFNCDYQSRFVPCIPCRWSSSNPLRVNYWYPPVVLVQSCISRTKWNGAHRVHLVGVRHGAHAGGSYGSTLVGGREPVWSNRQLSRGKFVQLQRNEFAQLLTLVWFSICIHKIHHYDWGDT